MGGEGPSTGGGGDSVRFVALFVLETGGLVGREEEGEVGEVE